ncbi:MAG: transcription antitermination factor NusB [Firmicutes bacterium]|nr:transcription antitermination factor NusB [Bacillota bacterium]MBQ6900517.1 transcription antitermination factor NusB [Bacillota bacterium]MBR3706364.1 transcription antitermination factor NusB [Bacillota bacterium]
MARKEAREFAMQTLFQIDVHKDFENPDIEKYIGTKKLGNQKEYVKTLLTQICANIAQVDEKINECSENWPTVRMAKTDLAITRIAVGEILFFEDIPKAVAINEAVNLAKDYGTETSPKFINAILGKVEK